MLAILTCLTSLALSDPPLPPSQTGLLYISGSTSNNVGEFAPDGTLLRTLTAPNLTQPRGVAVDDHGNLAVVCQGSDRILILDLNGTVLQTVSHPDLVDGTGLARSADGDWYVANFLPGRVLTFDSDWNHLQTIEGPNLGAINCVSFDPDGSFAISDAINSRIMRFDAQHGPLGFVTHPSILSPMSIAMDSSGAHYVSNGSSGVITKFDAAWNFLSTFGGGTLASPQGIAIDEHDVLTISNFASSTVHRYDTQGNLLGSFQLSAVTTGRNLAWQSSPFALAHQGANLGPSGEPLRVLRANGSSGDALGHISLSTADPLNLSIETIPGWPNQLRVVLYAQAGVPSLGSVTESPGALGLFTFPTPIAGGSPAVLVNSYGREALLGTGLWPFATGPGTLADLPNGVQRPLTVTLQAFVEDPGVPGGGLRASNALVLSVQ